jgi:hypothetical protein
MMGGVSPETCWASYKYEIKFWYIVASCWILFVNYTGCPTRYRTRHFFNNSNTNEDISTKFEQDYVRLWEMKRNVSVVCVCFVAISSLVLELLKKMPGLVAGGTSCIMMHGSTNIKFIYWSSWDQIKKLNHVDQCNLYKQDTESIDHDTNLKLKMSSFIRCAWLFQC